MGRLVSVVLIVLLLTPIASAWEVPERGIIYQVMVDRFYDGNTSNNEPFYDPTHSNYRLYWGGDLEGLIEKLDYIKSLGVSMIWVSPLNDNINSLAYGSAPYHGYWTRDYKRIEEHFGGWEDFRRLVKEAKKRGICIIVDYVPNHSNPVNYGEYGALYDNGTFLTDYFKDTKNAEVNPITGIRENVYHHNGNIYTWSGIPLKYANLYGLADFNQLNPWVDSYLTEGAMLFVDSGACGLRIDAVKHMELGWLETFYLRLYSKGPLFIYGEYFTPSLQKGDDLYEFYRYSNVSPVLSIPIREDIVRIFAFFGGLDKLSEELGDYYSHFVYPTKAVNFLDSHDLVRFLNAGDRKDEIQRFHMALALTLTLPGIPVIYYGDESYLVSKDGKGDPYNRPTMVFDNTTEASRIIRTLGGLRKTNDALVFGDFMTVTASYETWAFERTFGNHSLLVVMNKGPAVNLTFSVDWPDGNYRDALYGGEMVVSGGKASVYLPRDSVYVFHIEGEQKKPLIGSITPYAARPGQEIVIGGAGFGKGGKVIIGGREAKVLSWEDGKIVVEVPRLETSAAWVNVTVVSDGGRSPPRPLRYYSGNDVPALIALNASLVGEVSGTLWLSGDLPELGEPRPLLKSSMGYYFTVAPLPEGVPFSVRLYEGKAWGALRPLNLTLYGVGNRTVTLTEKPPGVSEGQKAGQKDVALYALSVVMIAALIAVVWKRKG
ncbi:cyclodextrin glucanotransferase, GH13 family [Thermococcus kodakarensis KOD1]|uniref:Cyclodextrin glucanotransferase n=1 Tax=Thermococcus kodakarensis (strain ATCC BAA-918 / JCM 12380 / KOD1) TaxID=69014 RepID=Q8X268_THEKO|nr:alpha-amylase family glycosyl hydrolase [Thermococcus kodakarensis]WCN28012.1 alpha-amylase family glycosyl hydrolase [Thermococcus kodakarensis]WCN30310.1 alpha-amylase family glycosyl hydrolase [Thermococcus kodakarensis]BAB78538.1 cyclodextrin glucanotransferase [Thermococcus kodakarensis KOD1]BAD86361.1 cyclodextrin glucanotransferase, GH13 family [Thermococcus kodakarensis KOD1]